MAVEKYLYCSHMGGVFTSDEKISFDDLYCEQCGDSDDFLGCVDVTDLDQLTDAASCISWSSGYLCTPAGLACIARDYGDAVDGEFAAGDSPISEYAYDKAGGLIGVLQAVGYPGADEMTLDEAEKIIRDRVFRLMAENGVYPFDEEKVYEAAKTQTARKTAGEALADDLIGVFCDHETGKPRWAWRDSHYVSLNIPDPWWSAVFKSRCENVAGYLEMWNRLTADGSRVHAYDPRWAGGLARDFPDLAGRFREFTVDDAVIDE